MKKAIILLPLVLSLSSCKHTGEIKISYSSLIECVSERGIYKYEEGEGKTVDILFYFRNATSVDLSYFSDSKNDKMGFILYVVDDNIYEGKLNFVIIKDMPNRSDYYQYYYHNFKEDGYTYRRTILFKIPTSFFRNDRGMFWVSRGAYHKEREKPEDRISRLTGIRLRYQKIMDNKMIEIW